MNRKISIRLAGLVILLAGILACSLQATAIPTIIPTETKPVETATPTLPPATETPSPTPTMEPTSIPGTTFDVTSRGLDLTMEVPSCGVISVGFGGKSYSPLSGDAELCLMSVIVVKGVPSQDDIDEWVISDNVYLLNRAGDKGLLIYASYNSEKRTMLWMFSVPDNFAMVQLQLLDQLVDLP